MHSEGHSGAHSHCEHTHASPHSHNHAGHHGAHVDFTDRKLQRTLLLGIAANCLFVLVEASVGWITNSVALLADALHNLGDVLGLGMSWGAVVLSTLPATARHTWGYQRSSILVALVQALALLILVAFTVWEGIERIFAPVALVPSAIVITACLGILINGATAYWLHRHDQADLNVRGAFLHMVGDAAVSGAVVISGLIIAFTQWWWIDPLISFLIAGMILASTWGLLIKSFALNLDAVPSHIRLSDVAAALQAIPGVTGVHHLHIWNTSTTTIALTAHLVYPSKENPNQVLRDAAALLRKRFGIGHSTLQLETEVLTEHCHECE